MVYDTVSGEVFEQSLQAVRKWGRIITVFTGTDPTQQDLMSAFINAATIHTQNMSLPLILGKGRMRHGEILKQAALIVDAGHLKPYLDPNRFTFSQINQAHKLFESGQHVGKIVLEADW